MNYTAMRSAAMAALEEFFSGSVAVDPFPDDAPTYTLSHVNGALLVYCNGSGFARQNQTLHKRTIRVDVHILAHHATGENSTEFFVDRVLHVLTNRMLVNGCTSLAPVNDQYLGVENEVCQHVVSFESNGPWYAQLPESENTEVA